MLPPLRPHQSYGFQAVESALSRLRSAGRPTSVLAIAPGGAGKTRQGLEHALQGEGALWIAPSRDLVRQPVQRLQAMGWTDLAWYEGGKLRGREGARLTVATIQALSAMRRRGQALPRATRLILDEARNHLAPDWRLIPALYPHADIIGLDGSPVRESGAGLGEQYQEAITVAQPPELIQAGYMVPSRILAPREGHSALAARPVDAYLRWAQGRRVVVFCRDKAHAEQSAAEFNQAGITARCLTDESPTSDRERVLGDSSPGLFSLGAVQVVTCALLLRQGIDVPEIDCVILARAMGSLSAFLQAIWRGSRPAPGKLENLVLDLYGAVHTHDHPDRARDWPLTGEIGRPVQGLPPLVQCKACGVWGSGGGCDVCGATLPKPPPPRVRAADLAEYRQSVDSIQDKQARLLRFVREAVGKGHNPWAAKHRYRGTYKEDPPKQWMYDAIHAIKVEQAKRAS